MINNSEYLNALLKTTNTQELLEISSVKIDNLYNNELKYLNISPIIYNPKVAIEELGLDLELINQLLEDYVRQILTAKETFIKYIKQLQENKSNNIKLHYKELRELSHKNLGVARNLRILDAEVILNRLMIDDDVTHMLDYIDALIASVVILKPECAYNTLSVLKIKDSF